MNPTSSEVASDIFISIAFLTDVGRVRTNNQDAFIVTDLTERESLSTSEDLLKRPLGTHGLLLAVADGMGGALAGDVASRIGIEQLSLQLINASEKRPVSEWLRQAIKGANREVRRASAANSSYHGMGATMTAAVIHNGKAIIVQVGDSRGYLIREGHIQQVTKDQSLVQAMVDAGQLTEDDAKKFHFRNVILKALGAEDEIEPDINAITLARGDYLLLCSDGLSNKVGNVEMHDIILETESLKAACDRLVALANERGGEDNITLVVARLDGEGLPVVEEGDSIIRVEHETGA